MLIRPVQQQWLDVHQVGGMYSSDGYEKPHLGANPKKFEKTTYKTIALEINEFNSDYFGKGIDFTTMDQLIRVLNYGHDQGGRRIILINQTSYNNGQLLEQIKKQLPGSEKERTWSRLMLLLGDETEDSIFKHEQFNGHIETIVPQQQLVDRSGGSLNRLSVFRNEFGRFFTKFMDSKLLDDSLFSTEGTPDKSNFYSGS